jgi:hypothetical protein
MTQSTDKRNLSLLVKGILQSYGVDNLELECKLIDGVRAIYSSPTPVRTREEILESLRQAVATGSTRADKLQAITDEIYSRTRIRAVTKEWQDFVEFCHRQEKDGKTISKFLDWWLGDKWQAEHPPARPDTWVVKWDIAFTEPEQKAQPDYMTNYFGS